MAPIGKDHQSIVDQLNRMPVRAVGDDAIVRVQGSIRSDEWSEPEPDVVVLRPRPDFYRGKFAAGTDSLLVIEVSDTTLPDDRDRKVSLYARDGVPEVWIVDVQDDSLLVYGDLRNDAYARRVVPERPAAVPLGGMPGVVLDLVPIFSS